MDETLTKLEVKNMENETQTTETKDDWIKQEADSLNTHDDYDDLPSFKFEENKTKTFEVDFSEPFKKWTGNQGSNEITKAIIPVSEDGEKKNLWLNTKNPLYSDIVRRGANGQTVFKIVQTGTQASTKYTIIED